MGKKGTKADKKAAEKQADKKKAKLKAKAKAKKNAKVKLPKKKCCVSAPKCSRCPLRALKDGTLPEGYTVKRRRLVKVA